MSTSISTAIQSKTPRKQLERLWDLLYDLQNMGRIEGFKTGKLIQFQSLFHKPQLKQVGRHSKIKRVGRRKLEPRHEKPHPPKPLRGHF